MKRISLILPIATTILLLLLGGLYLFVVRPRLAPFEVGPLTKEVQPKRTKPREERTAALNLYFHAPLALSGITRIELTLTGIEVGGDEGERYTVFEGSRRITIQEDIVQKIASERISPGRLDNLVLSFGPTARILSQDRSSQTVFLPRRKLSVDVRKDIPTSRTLDVLIALPKNAAFGEKNGLLALELPPSAESEQALLGGFHLDERSVGEFFTLPDATIRDAIYADIGLDITPREGARGSRGFGAADENQPNPAQ